MWLAHSEQLAPNVCKYSLTGHGQALTNEQVIRLLAGSAAFSDYISTVLAASLFPAFFWECAPVCRRTLGRRFEFVIANCEALCGVDANPAPFMDYCRHRPAGGNVVKFENPGGDAVLVTPCPVTPDTAWPHLAEFLRTAPAPIKREFWSCTGAAILEKLDKGPVWISTSGLGVYWLHLRLDTRPKYYTFEPYRQMA